MNKINLINKFIQHPNAVGMTYLQHFRFAFNLAFRLFIAACCSVIHAVFPFLFTSYSSSTIRELNDLFNKRYHEDNK